MKHSWIKRKTGFKNKGGFLRRTALAKLGKSPSTLMKNEIQAILRQIVIIRDGGCFLRHFKNRINHQYQECGGLTKAGELILQAEHLHTRANAASFADTRLVVCICKRHHVFYKPQHSDEYNGFAREFIGKERSELWEKVKNDRIPHKVDLALELVALKQELSKLTK